MRYYYTDPIKAAWMEREFDFEITNARNSYTYARWQSIFEHLIAFGNGGCIETIEGHKYYIHPDCHEMLKPKTKDWGRALDGEACFYCEGWRSFNKPLEIIKLSAEIIRRNGKAFFAPKQSIDSHLPTQNINDILKA